MKRRHVVRFPGLHTARRTIVAKDVDRSPDPSPVTIPAVRHSVATCRNRIARERGVHAGVVSRSRYWRPADLIKAGSRQHLPAFLTTLPVPLRSATAAAWNSSDGQKRKRASQFAFRRNTSLIARHRSFLSPPIAVSTARRLVPDKRRLTPEPLHPVATGYFNAPVNLHERA